MSKELIIINPTDLDGLTAMRLWAKFRDILKSELLGYHESILAVYEQILVPLYKNEIYKDNEEMQNYNYFDIGFDPENLVDQTFILWRKVFTPSSQPLKTVKEEKKPAKTVREPAEELLEEKAEMLKSETGTK